MLQKKNKNKTTTAQPVFNTPLIVDAAEEMHHNPGTKLINRGFSLCLMVKLVLHRCSPRATGGLLVQTGRGKKPRWTALLLLCTLQGTCIERLNEG